MSHDGATRELIKLSDIDRYRLDRISSVTSGIVLCFAWEKFGIAKIKACDFKKLNAMTKNYSRKELYRRETYRLQLAVSFAIELFLCVCFSNLIVRLCTINSMYVLKRMYIFAGLI